MRCQTRKAVRVLSLVGLLAAASHGALAQTATLIVSQQPSLQPLTCTGILVSAPFANWIFGDSFESGDTSAWGTSGSRFPVTAILDLGLEVQTMGIANGTQVLHVRLLTPKGHLYQILTAPISSGVMPLGAKARVEGFPRPVAIQTVAAGEGTVSFSFPVAGTSIVSSSLFGEWTVEAYLENESTACALSRFELEP